MVLRFASLDRSKPLTGLDFHINDVFQKCVQVAPPAVGNSQRGISECQNVVTMSLLKSREYFKTTEYCTKGVFINILYTYVAARQLAQQPRPATSAPSETVTRRRRGRPSRNTSSDLPRSLSRTSFLCTTPVPSSASASSSVSTEVNSSALGSSLSQSTSPVISIVLPQSNARSSHTTTANPGPSDAGTTSSGSQPTFKVPAPVSQWSSVANFSPGNYRPISQSCEGYVFTNMCLFNFRGGGVCLGKDGVCIGGGEADPPSFPESQTPPPIRNENSDVIR